MWRFTVLLGLFFMVSVPGMAAAGQVKVFASILPQQYFIEKIGGEHVAVEIMVEPGASPATYEPRPRQMADLAAADVYFAIGVPFEQVWLKKFTAANKRLRMVHTEAGIEKRPMQAHRHAAEDQHNDHEPIRDPHIWLSPGLVKIQAAHIRDALIGIDPANRQDYLAGCNRFMAEIEQLDRNLRELFAADTAPREFMVFHPSWGYFAADYGLTQIPVELEGKDPKPAQLQELIDTAREHGIKVVFVQPQFSTRSANVIAEAIGGRVVPADPLAQDWAANLWQTAIRFKEPQ